MKISIIHSYYSDQDKSGENNVVDAQISLLTSIGHEVMVFSNSTVEEQKRKFFQLRASANVIFGIGNNPENDLDKFKPDAIFMHNLFPNLSTKWLEKYGHRTYSFKHNYRDICASANLYRNSSICFKCVEGTSFNAVKYRCYKNSALKSLPLAIRNSLKLECRLDLAKPRKILVLSEHMKKLLFSSGIEKDKLEVIPNFVHDSYGKRDFSRIKNGHWVAAGRLTEEKGFSNLIKNWPSGFILDIYGSGSQLQKLKEMAATTNNININGSLSRKDFINLLPSYDGAILPSQWFEPGPLVILEYLAAGLPVISIGAWSEAAGLDKKFHIELLNNSKVDHSKLLEKHILEFTNNQKKYSKLQRNKYIKYYSPENWHSRLLEIISH